MKGVGQSATKPGKALAGIHVLLVDDDRDMRDALQFLLEGYGAEVVPVNCAVDALAALRRSRPDVLLSDILMPGESGYDLMRKIIASEGEDAPPAAALSSYGEEAGRELAIAAGFQTLMAKPVEPGALIELIATLAGRTEKKDGAWI